ncbi:MAG: aminoglycoside phosphotransferase family protein [Anaerolinea sp.]|nr:aminoglycoside phosphotransferase family protein [Anaerolinea sp.]
MLEKPDISDAAIIDCLRAAYTIDAADLRFLPLGADRSTAVYRAETRWFVKLRRGEFDVNSVIVPHLLHGQGMTQVIAPVKSAAGDLWTPLGDFKLILFPFVEGHGGWDADLSAPQWVEFGRALKRLHTAHFPPDLLQTLPQEDYSPRWRERTHEFQALAAAGGYRDAIAADLARFLVSKRPEIDALIAHAERLASVVQARALPSIVCHADIHVGNLLHTPDSLYIVDWDTLTFAPKERDLMFVGGGLGGGAFPPEEEIRLFYQGYGQTEIDADALAYYRCERIVQDIVAYCEAILLAEGDSADRSAGVRQLKSQFEPGNVVEIALASTTSPPRP